jgi:signal transduction histidine kinase
LPAENGNSDKILLVTWYWAEDTLDDNNQETCMQHKVYRQRNTKSKILQRKARLLRCDQPRAQRLEARCRELEKKLAERTDELAALNEAENHRAEQFRLIAEVSHRFTSTLEFNEVMQQVARLIQQTFGYYHVGIGLIEADEVVYRVGAGILWDNPQFQFKPAHLKVGKEGLSGWVAATGESLLVADVSLEPRYVWLQGSQTRSELTVPISVKGKIIGVLDIQSDQLENFDHTDLELMHSLANQAGVAIENARLYEQAKQVAVLEERNRLARELHDSVTQTLYGMGLYAQAAIGQLALGNLEQVGENLREIIDTSQEVLAEMRLLIHELRPPVLVQDGLDMALQARLSAVEGRAGLQTSLKSDLAGRLPATIEEGFYRIALEALNNVVKHAHAHTVAVYLSQHQNVVTLEITDDGFGFDPQAVKAQGGMGLPAMQERAAALGGQLTIWSKPGEGAHVVMEVQVSTTTR